MPSSNRSGTSSVAGSSLSGWTVSSRPGFATSTPQCGPRNLYGEHAKKSAPRATTSTGACAVRCTPSTKNSAPACVHQRRRSRRRRAGAEQVRRAGDGDQPGALGQHRRDMRRRSARPVAGSKSIHRTVAPAPSAACTHGRTFASWSSLLTTTSSPGAQSLASARARSKVSWVMLRPKTTPPGSPCSRSAMPARAPSVIVVGVPLGGRDPATVGHAATPWPRGRRRRPRQAPASHRARRSGRRPRSTPGNARGSSRCQTAVRSLRPTIAVVRAIRQPHAVVVTSALAPKARDRRRRGDRAGRR